MQILTLSSLDHAFKCYFTKRQLAKICNVSRNLSSWFSAMSRGISLSCFQPIKISIGLFLPLLGLTWIIPNSDFGNFEIQSNLWLIIPNGRNGLIPDLVFGQLYIQSEFWLISPNGRNGLIPDLGFGQLYIQSEFWLIGQDGRNGLIPNLGFGQLYIQSKFWLISPNGLNENSQRR